MEEIRHGLFSAVLAQGAEERSAALALRAQAFRGGAPDDDGDDGVGGMVLIARAGRPAATFRLRRFGSAGDILTSYSGRRYDLTRLAGRGYALAEMGRFCTAPGARDPDLIRMAWAAVARLASLWRSDFLFGCTSFPGTEPAAHAASLGLLARQHLAPPDWAPGRRAPETVPVAGLPPPADPARALAALPPLLRSYLALGARVSDHAVIDRDLGTFHLFTGLPLAAIPPARARALRHLAG